MPQFNSSTWQGMGSPGTGLSSTIAPWAAIYADSRIMVMCADRNGYLQAITQRAPNGVWGGWVPFGIAISGRPATGGIASRMQIFVVDANQRLQYREQLAPNSDSWGPWTALSNNVAVQGPTVRGRHRDGRLVFFVTGLDGAVYYTTQLQFGSSGYTPLKALTSPRSIQGPPDVASNADGRLEVFGQGLDGKLYHSFQRRVDADDWDVWYPVDNQTTLAGTPVAAGNADGRLEVFARGLDNKLMHIYQVAPNGGWSGWSPLLDVNNTPGYMQNRPTVVTNPDGRLEVFFRAGDNSLGQICQSISPTPGWSVLSTIGGTTQSVPAVARNADGRLEVFVYADGQLWHTYQIDMLPYYLTDGSVANVMNNGEVFYSTLPATIPAPPRSRFFILKSEQDACRFEEFEYDNNFIYRLKDTSWAAVNASGRWEDAKCDLNNPPDVAGKPAYYTVMQPPPPGEAFVDSQAYWRDHQIREGAAMPRRMFVGQEYRVHNVLVAFSKASARTCKVTIGGQRQDQPGRSQFKLTAVGPVQFPGSSVQPDDVIQLMTTWGAGAGESFYYARGYGWVAFGNTADPNGLTHIVSKKTVTSPRNAQLPPCP
jgi:hypothetical protein